ncbi:MAG TPA: TonB-dependent receptor [Sphingomicrobium sp.]|nr:TonB-dependent receptor [Sphingomicrobium sp.]
MSASDHGVEARPDGLRSGVSLFVLATVLAALPSGALAQAQEPTATPVSSDTSIEAVDEDAPPSDDEIIVTGTRRALKTSQDIKRSADTIVDSITATDIGAFPDKSVAEALQRVPGITVNRFAASDDTSHFSAEPSGVLVRGLQQVRNEINGRDTFSANSSRGLGWGDVSPELLAGVDTYKNQTAEMIEGGIAGSVNIRTRVPFDAPGQVIQASVNANYGDIAEKVTPEFSGIYSNRWQTGIGEIGILGNFAHSRVKTASQGVHYGRTGIFEDFYGAGETFYIPSSAGYRETFYDRERNGIALAAQWRDAGDKFLVTTQYNRSTYENTWNERGVIAYFFDMFALPTDFVYRPGGPRASWAPVPAQGTPAFTFDSSGNFESGVLNIQQTDTGWWGVDDTWSDNIAVNDQGEAMLHPCYNWQASCTNPNRAPDVNAVTRLNQNRNMTQDLALNLKWKVNDRLRTNFDAQYVDSTVKNYDVEVGQYSFADVLLDATGGRPELEFFAPTNINQSGGGLSNPNNYRYNHVMDHREDSEGQEIALRADGEYDLGGDWLDSLKFGGRYADRDQLVRYSAYNWGNIANNWNLDGNQAVFWNIDRHAPNGAFTGYPTGLYETRPFGGGFFGGSTNPFVFFDMDALEDHRADELAFANIGVGQDRWAPICTRPDEVDGCYQADEINDVSEATRAGYAMLRFGGDNARIGKIGVVGNLGLRYVNTRIKSDGSLSFPRPFQLAFNDTDADPNNDRADVCVDAVPQPGQPAPAIPQPVSCYLSAQDIAFASGGGIEGAAKAKHTHLLPSFNVRLDFGDSWFARFAASKAMSRPDIGLLKNYIALGSSLPGQDPTDPRWVRNSSGAIVGVTPSYVADAYNPYVAPMTAWQFDLSLEKYFGNVGSFSLAGFYKSFNDYIQYGSYDLDVTNAGVTRTVQVRGPINGDGAKVYGFEGAFQRFFDFLPKPFDGLGVQANYTYVRNKGVSNTNLKSASGGASGATPQPGSAGTVIEVDSLEGLSKHAYNLVGMYEKGPLALRLAYNWRSKYLVTAVDCCVYLPIWQDSAGFLDGSISMRFAKRFEVSVKATNLLDTKTVLRQQVTDASDGGVLTPNAWVHSDRRYVFGVRFRY